MFHLVHTQLPFIVNLLILLLVAKFLGELAERFRQPSMIGEVIAGVILGPSVLHIIPDAGEIKVIAELGVFMLIVLAGMEIEVEEIRNSIRGKNIWIALLGFIVPMASGISIGLIFHFSYSFTIFLGLCIAITALPVSIRILMDLGKLKTDVGQRIISAAIFNDIIALLILGIILDFNDTTKNLGDLTVSILFTTMKVGVFTGILMIAYHFFKLAKRKVNVINPRMNEFTRYLRGKESIFALVILFVLIFSSIAELLGLHFVVGAFFGAILIPRSMFANRDFEKVQRSISGITMGFLAPIFFATMGISFNFGSFDNGMLLIAILFASFFSKIFGGYLGGRLAGFNQAKSITLGLGLNARGIMELVIANIALAKGFIDVPVFSILVLMALLTTILTPFLLKEGFRLIDKKRDNNPNSYT
ncbi:MAG: cation:proton antiporter [Bacteroidota bacterium]